MAAQLVTSPATGKPPAVEQQALARLEVGAFSNWIGRKVHGDFSLNAAGLR
jgi:hypothetical protein